ncbi:MAG: hypothetical protein RMM06_07855 [Armatimonadota bacterium]|nr:hypothetical protein [bacterium]MCS7310197.1 hypothetical protein [Armatimonadota bacterium]MDW8104576.1 hypothetical protein [Armatimonadota bacterium]MDW8290622.1 hypothetical protein [Armatimonadota bacterium]
MKTASKTILWLVIVLLVVTAALWAQSRTPTATLSRTQRLELVDKDGNVRAELKTSGENTLLVLYDGQGRLRTVIDTESISFYGTDGKLLRKFDAQNAPASP